MTRLLFRRGRQNELLCGVRKKLNLSERKFSKHFSIKRTTYRNWASEECTLPAAIFQKICNEFPDLKRFERYIKKKYPDNWGLVKGGRKKSILYDTKQNFKIFNKKRNHLRLSEKKALRVVRNTYIDYILDSKINLKPLLAIFLITDGTVSFKTNLMECSNKDPYLRDLAYFLFYKLGKYAPKIYLDAKEVYRVRLIDKNLIEEMRKLTPTFKTSPGRNQDIKDYLKKPQPTINFLNNYSSSTVKESIRLAFSTDGSVSLDGHLILSCANIALCKEWRTILDKYGIRMNIWKNKNSWCGCSGLGLANSTGLKKFNSLGGFIPYVRVSKKSKYFVGWKKNEVLNYVIHRRNIKPKGNSILGDGKGG